MPLQNGYELKGRYRIDEIIAQGGMGAIYRATDISLEIEVAVKENFFPSEEAIRQFTREARILANLRHSNLPRVTDHFEIPEHGQYLIMDFIDGKDLKEILAEQGAISEIEAIRIGKAVCNALGYLHNRNPPIIHRDIKPGNIKITSGNEIYLVDFGLAKQDAAGEVTMTGAQALTPGFAPPEQYGQGTDLRSDIYSLGATLYAGVTVTAPPDGLTRAARNQTLVDIRTKNAKISSGLEAIIQKAMMLSPNDRYQNSDEFLNALNHINQVTPVLDKTILRSTQQDIQDVTEIASVRQVPPINVEKQVSKRKRPIIKQWWFFVILFIFLIGTGFGVSQILQKGKTFNSIPTDRMPTMTNNVVALMEEEVILTNTVEEKYEISITATNTEVVATLANIPTETPEPTTTEEPIIEATPMGGGGGKLAFASDRNGEPQIYLLDIVTRDISQLTTVSGGACQPDFSPDGSQIVFISPCAKSQQDYLGSRLFIMQVDGSRLFPLNTLPGGDFDPAWNPADDNIIAFTSYRNNSRPHIFLYDLATKSVIDLSAVTAYDRAADWSPDGQYLVYQQVYDGVNGIFYVKPGESKRISISNTTLESFSPAWSNDGELVYYSQGKNLPSLVGRQVNNLSSPESIISDIKPIWDAVFSPDDYWIAYMGLGSGTNRDIFIMLSNGGFVENLTSDGAYDFDPVWHP